MLRSLIRLPSPFAARPLADTTPNAALPSAPPADPYAGWVVGVTWGVMLGVTIAFVARNLPSVPLWMDDYCNIPILFGPEGKTFAGFWAQHNEHRIPLPRLLYVAAFRLAGDDFRGPAVLNLALLAATSILVVQALRRARGGYAYTDAFVPLVMLHPGHGENLLWGFQIQFISSVVLGLWFLCLVASDRFAGSAARAGAASAVTLALPLCGANGVALVPALACFLLFVAGRNLRSGDPTLRRPGAVALAGGLGGLALIPAYFYGLQSCAHHVKPDGWYPVVTSAVNFLGLAFGIASHGGSVPLAHAFTGFGLMMLAVLTVTVGMLLAVAVRNPGRRVAALGVLCAVGGVVSLGLGLAYGRSGIANLAIGGRYITLALPLAIGAYFAWALVAPAGVGRAVAVVLLGVASAALWPNLSEGLPLGRYQVLVPKRLAQELRAGMPRTFVIDRNIPPDFREPAASWFGILRDHRVGPFADLRDDPPLTETPVPVTFSRRDGVAADGDFLRTTGDRSAVVIPLPRRQFVYGLKLVYEATCPDRAPLLSLLSWEPGGEPYSSRPGFGIVEQIRVRTEPTVTYVYVNQETDALRIDITGAGARLRVHSLTVLTPAE